jgi:hypothetical protein
VAVLEIADVEHEAEREGYCDKKEKDNTSRPRDSQVDCETKAVQLDDRPVKVLGVDTCL